MGQARQLEEEQKGRRVAQTGKQDRSREVRALWAAVQSFTALCKGSLHQSFDFGLNRSPWHLGENRLEDGKCRLNCFSNPGKRGGIDPEGSQGGVVEVASFGVYVKSGAIRIS